MPCRAASGFANTHSAAVAAAPARHSRQNAVLNMRFAPSLSSIAR